MTFVFVVVTGIENRGKPMPPRGDTFSSFVTRVPRHGRKPRERVRLDKSGRLPVFINTLTLHESEPPPLSRARGDAVTKRVSRISSVFLPMRRAAVPRVSSCRLSFSARYKSPGFLSGPAAS